MHTFDISTSQQRQVVDITDRVVGQISGEVSGIAHIFISHTTAGVTTADLDPGTDLDLLDFLEAITPELNWRHPHNPQHTPAHLLASLIGPDISVPFEGGQLRLGAWQRIILIEFDGPRERQVVISISREG